MIAFRVKACLITSEPMLAVGTLEVLNIYMKAGESISTMAIVRGAPEEEGFPASENAFRGSLSPQIMGLQEPRRSTAAQSLKQRLHASSPDWKRCA